MFWMGETWVVLADSIRELRRDFQLGCLMMEMQDFKGAEHRWRIANDLGEPKARPWKSLKCYGTGISPRKREAGSNEPRRRAVSGAHPGSATFWTARATTRKPITGDASPPSSLQKKVSRRLKATTPNNDSNICATRETLIRRMDVQRSVTVTIKIDQHSN